MILWLLACTTEAPFAPARVEPTPITSAKSWVRTLDTDATHVYWASYDPTSGRSARAVIERAPLAGGPSEEVASESHPPEHLAVYGGFVYYSYGSGSLKRVPVTGGEPTVLLDDSASCFSIDDSGVYLIHGVEVLQIDPTTSEKRVVADKALATCPVPLGDNVYWIERTGIFRVPKAGGTPEKYVALKKCESLVPFEGQLYTCYDGILTQIDPASGDHKPIRSMCKGENLQVSSGAHWITADYYDGWPPERGTRIVEVTSDGPSYLFEGQGASAPRLAGDDLVWFGRPEEGQWGGFSAPVPLEHP